MSLVSSLILYAKDTKPIFTNIGGKLAMEKTVPLEFGCNPDHVTSA